MVKPRTSTPPAIYFGAAALILLLTLTPFASASAANHWYVVGEFEWLSLGGILVMLSIVALVAAIIAGFRAWIKGIPFFGNLFSTRTMAFGVFVVALLLASLVNPGGILGGMGSAPAASAAGGTVSFDAAAYESTSDVTFYVADEATRTALNAVVSLYKPGVTEKAAFEGTAKPEYSGTASSGSITFNGVQTQTLGCTMDVGVSIASYYQKLVTNVNICAPKNLLGQNDVSAPTIYLDKVGTLSLASSDSTHTCALSTSCDYTVILRNSAVDTAIYGVALKWSPGDGPATLNSATGGCEIVEVSTVKYIRPTTGKIGSLGTMTCVINLSYTAAAGQTWNLTADDHFQAFGATAFNSHASIRGATATAAYEVARA